MDNALFEFDAPKTFSNLYEMANSNDDGGADKIFDIIATKKENGKSEPNLGSVNTSEDDFEENSAPVDDQFDDKNIISLVHELIHSANKSRTKLHDRHSITVGGIEIELPRIKHHAMITRINELENTPKFDLLTRSVARSEFKYEHINSGLEVFKSRNLFPDDFDHSVNPKNTNNNETKHSKIENNCIQVQSNQHLNSNINSSSKKVSAKPQKIKVLNSHDGVLVVENKELGHSGVKVLEKQLHTVPKPFSFESRKSCAVKPQNIKCTEQPLMFKARPATVLKRKPFVPKHEKKYTEPKNIRLNTERRAEEWMIFEREMKEKFSYYEKISEKKQEENAKIEMNLIKSMRQLTIHKPEPIKKYKPVLIKKSEKPTTIPRSPRFSIRRVKSYLKSEFEQIKV